MKYLHIFYDAVNSILIFLMFLFMYLFKASQFHLKKNQKSKLTDLHQVTLVHYRAYKNFKLLCFSDNTTKVKEKDILKQAK